MEVKKTIVAPSLTLEVDPLPSPRPANFSGAVGRFNMSASLTPDKLKANDALTLRVVVSGEGNMKLMKAPEARFPKDFETYDAKITDKTKVGRDGVSGNKVFDYLAVPRHQGQYEVPAVEFCYFDTKEKAYKTLKSGTFAIEVEKGKGGGGSGNYTNREDVELLASDIRYIHQGDVQLRQRGSAYYGTAAYGWSYVVPLLVLAGLVVAFRKQAKENANVARMRGKKANKVATRRLKKANRLMLDGKASLFYDEVLRALWGYVGDKLSIPVEDLSRENISQRLAERNVGGDTINLFIGALDECEFERYAPGDVKGNMNKTFEAAMTAIMRIEENMKKRRNGAAGKVVGLLALLFMLPVCASAITKANADSAYARQQYQQAIKDYEELLQSGASADLYYNLGNAYYRTDNITRAVLNYERALLLSPGDRDIRFNLQMARSKTIDKITPESEMFFVTWYHSLVNLMSVDGWAHTALVSLGLAIVLALVYLFSGMVLARKAGFFGGAAFILLFALSNVFAFQQKRELLNRTGAIIISSAVPVKSTPSKSGTDLFILHEGTKVEITDGSMRDWKEIKVADGKEGWIETSKIEII